MKKKKSIFYLILFLVLIVSQFLAGWQLALAAGSSDINAIIDEQIKGPGGLVEVGLPGSDDAEPLDWVVYLIKGLLGFMGMVFLVLIIYAGVKWMTSSGNSSTIDDAKKIMVNATIGIVIVAFSFAITQFVFSVILKQ